MPQSFTCLHYHIVFSTKHRAPLLTADWQPRLHEYMGGILRAHGGQLLAAGGMPDHIHLLAQLSKQQSVADAARVIKANSSGWVHQTFRERRDFAWQTGYAAFAVSYSHLSEVKKYITGQEKHHRKMTFQEELLAFLKRHNIEYDDRYIWD